MSCSASIRSRSRIVLSNCSSSRADRTGHRPQVEDDRVVVPVVEGLVRLDGVLPEDEPESDVVEPEGCTAVLAGSDRAGTEPSTPKRLSECARLGAK